MKKKLKKAAILVIAALMLLTVFSACTKTEEPDVPKEESTSAKVEAESESTAAPVEEETGLSFPLEETFSFELMMSESNQVPMVTDSLSVQAIKDLLNIEVVLRPVPQSDFSTKLSTTLATNSMPDVIDNVQIADLRTYGITGMFAALEDYSEYIPDYLGLVLADDRATETAKFRVGGELYGFRDLEKYRIGVAPSPMIRIDWLTEAGLQEPTSWAELYDALLAIKAAHPDSYAFSSRNGTNYMIGQYAYTLGSGGFQGFNKANGMYYEPDEDAYIYGPTDEDFKVVIEFLANAYKDGLLDPDYAIMTKDLCFEKLSTGGLFFQTDNNTHASRVWNPALQEADPNASFKMLDPLENSEGQTRQYRYERDWSNHAVISSQAEGIEKIMAFYNWMYTEEGTMVTNFGIEGETYEMVDGVPLIKQEILDRHQNDSDQYNGVQGELGVGLLCYAKYIDETTYIQTTDPMMITDGDKIQEATERGEIQFMPGWPPLSDDQGEREKTLQLQLGAIFDQEINNFITGERPMSEYDDLIADLIAAGSEELEQIYNDAYASLK